MEDNNNQDLEQQVSSLEESTMEKNDSSAMGKKALKDAANLATKELKSKVKAIVTKYAASVAIIIAKILLILFVVLVIIGAIEWIKEKFEAKESPKMFKEALGITEENEEDMLKEFVQIKKDDSGDGYHFEFADDFEEKVEKAAEYVGKKYSNLGDKELWKEFLMADFATQLPNLGGSGQVISISSFSSSEGNGFWWPIGSSQTTTKNGKTFASGEPEIPHGTNVIRGGVSRGWSSENHYKTSGEALDIGGNNQIGHYNVISMAKGVVERADDGFPNTGPNSDNGGMGNCVYVRYPGDILVRYMHLAQGTVSVNEGDEVDYGQVLGKMGHSGESYSPHLHIDMWIGSENSSGGQDVAAYMDQTNPRPSNVSNDVSNLDGFLFIGDSITVGLKNSEKLKGKDTQFVGSTGSTPRQWLENTTPASGEPTYSELPDDSDKIKGISIMLGTNEVSQVSEMIQLVQKIHEKYPNRPIFVQKIFQQNNYFDEITNYNNQMLQFCNSNDYATFIDATNGVKISDDGIHPTNKGYKTLAENIKKAITNASSSTTDLNISGTSSTVLKPEDSPETTDELTDDEEDFINKAPKEFQGTIKMKRIAPNRTPGTMDTNVGLKTTELKYVSPEEFDDYISKGDSKALDTFTLSDDFSEIITAKWSYDGSIKIEKNSGIDYRNLTANYAMPYEYPMMFQVTGKDALFSQRLMYLVLGSSVDVCLVDNVSITQTKEYTTTTITTTDPKKKTSTTTTNTSLTGDEYKENVYTSTELGAVNSWWAKRSSTYTLNANSNFSSTTGDAYTVIGENKTTTTQIKKEITNISYSIRSQNTDFESNHEPFCTIYNGSRGKANTQVNWLLDFMGENDRTANMVELTKYLLYKATGVDYGVTEFDDINLTDFEGTYSGIYGGTIQEKVWWALKDLGYSDEAVAGAMGNIDYESAGFNANIVEGGSGEGIGLIQWSYGRRTQLENYAASKGVSWKDEDTQIEFLVAEISGEGPAASASNQRLSGYIGDEGITATHDDWANAKTVDAATLAFMRFFESPGSRSSYSERASRSSKYLAEFKNAKRTGGGDGNESLSSTPGIRAKYASSSGKTYTEYWQNIQAGCPWYSTDGCFHCSLATVMSGFGSTKTPNQLTGFSYGSGCYGYQSDAASVGCSYPHISAGEVEGALKSGDPVMLEIPLGGTLVTDNGSHTYTYSQHWVALLDYKNVNGKGKVYIHNPWQGEESYGWTDINNITRVGTQFIHFYK